MEQGVSGKVRIETGIGDVAAGSIRDYLAERLHDGPFQELVAARMKIASILGARDVPDPELGQVAECIDTAVTELRAIIESGREAPAAKPRPVAPSRPDLYAEIAALCADFRAETGIACTFEILPEHTRFGYQLTGVLRRCFRELLLNVRKHAQASRVRLRSGMLDSETMFLCVEDNGVGFPPADRLHSKGTREGFGLWSIDHRLGQFGGFTEIESGDGLTVRIALPVKLLDH
jgi:signal transduction histidine kinase